MAPKVMIFAWTTIQNALPVAAELFKKKSLTLASCSLCLNAWEFVGHAMFSCKHARQVWKIVGFAFNYKAAVSMKAEDFLFQLSECYTKSELEMIFCTMWSIWSDRNNVIHGKLAQQPTTIFAKAQNFLNNYKSSQQLSLPTSLSPTGFPSTCKVWKPPPPNCLKLNVDVAFNAACHKIGFGSIIRDSKGIVKAAMSHPINGCCQPQEMEAKGLFYSLKWARQFNFKVDTVEIDSLILANAPHKSTSNRSSFQDLIIDVQTQLSYLLSVCVNHVCRDANQVAHGLAKQALVLDNVCTWLEDFPSAILSVVMTVDFNVLALLSQNRVEGSRMLMLNSLMREWSQANSKAVLAMALYFASADDRDTVCCFLDFQEMSEFPRNMQYPDMDLLVSKQAPQSV
ncbi:uncharacterized protein LOC115719959 [Cannabis sativa]|uniref:uncharacterized protein LOC115719959 n=1 Tax=Cannabis sativa TaxID=3483 RepID=UPI0029CA7056|nr:uncharacterized protein LOC115719959 [Cannabis sativa]